MQAIELLVKDIIEPYRDIRRKPYTPTKNSRPLRVSEQPESSLNEVRVLVQGPTSKETHD